MTWLIEDSPYWVCESCGRPAPYKPVDCDEERHERYYRKKVLAMRKAYSG